MSDTLRGMVVYHRVSHSRGAVTASNQFTGKIAVRWDDGSKQILDVSELMSEQLYEQFKEEERIKEMSLKPNEATLHAVVYQAGHAAPLARGKIAGPLTGSILIIEWDDGRLTKMDIKNLLTETKGLAETKRLQDEQTKLEEEFAQVEEKVAEKLADAAKLINDAAKMANKANADIQEMYEATRPLVRAMEAAGWNTSSWSC